MSAEQCHPPCRPELRAEVVPTPQRVRGEAFPKLVQSIPNDAQFVDLQSRVQAQHGLGLGPGGHGVVEPFLPIQNGAQLVPTADAKVAFGPRLRSRVGPAQQRAGGCLGGLQPVGQAIEPRAGEQGGAARGVQSQGAVHQRRRVVGAPAALLELGELNEDFRRHIFGFRSHPQITLRQFRVAKIARMIPRLRERLGFLLRDADGLFEAGFSRRVIAVQTVVPSQSQQDHYVGGRHAAGPFEDLDRLLPVLALPGLLRGIEHPVDGPLGD